MNKDGYRLIPELFARFMEGSVTDGTGKVWVYTPPTYRPRGKRYTARERLRRRRFFALQAPFTFEAAPPGTAPKG